MSYSLSSYLLRTFGFFNQTWSLPSLLPPSRKGRGVRTLRTKLLPGPNQIIRVEFETFSLKLSVTLCLFEKEPYFGEHLLFSRQIKSDNYWYFIRWSSYSTAKKIPLNHVKKWFELHQRLFNFLRHCADVVLISIYLNTEKMK